MGEDDDRRGIRQLSGLFGGVGALNAFAGVFFLVSGLGAGNGCIPVPASIPGLADCLAPAAYHGMTAAFFVFALAYGTVSALLLQGRRSRRIRLAGIALLVLLLLNPPLGTGLALYGLYLFHRERERFGDER